MLLSNFRPIELIKLNSVTQEELDKQWEETLSDDNISKAKEEGDRIFRGQSEDYIKQLRWLCKTEPFFLCYTVLGYTRLSTGLHGNLAEWIKNTSHIQFREILLPRGHFKSTLCTIADSIRIILPDDSNSLPHPYNLGTNCRLLIAHETLEQATKFLFAITQQFLSNPMLMRLFPECIPNPRQQKINKNELELPRTARWPEPTIDTMGVGGKSQGRHYNFLKLDDLFGDKARDSKAERDTTIQWFDNIQSFFSLVKADKFDIIGTRWGMDDLYHHLHKNYDNDKDISFVKYIRPVREPVIQPDKSIKKVYIFPEEFDDKVCKVLEKNRKVWTAQYLNDPQEGGTKYQRDWKQLYKFVDEKTCSNIEFYDRDLQELKYVNVWSLDRIILVDPAVTGEYGLCITGMDTKRRIFVLEAEQKVFGPAEFMDWLFRKAARWQVRCVGIEEVLFSILYQTWCLREQTIRNQRFKIEPLKVKKQKDDKELRADGLSTYFSANQIFFHESQHDLLEQFDYFGTITNYHVLDALAHGPQLWRTPTPEGIANSMGEMIGEEDRDPVYGYSNL
jgi:hypothetical protein